MKPDEKKKAIELRKLGHSLNDIANEVGVSKSTVSLWVRDLVLTKEQLLLLHGHRIAAHIKGRIHWSNLNRRKRAAWQKEGRNQAKKGEWLHAAGCMLYWGEGTKSCNSNCDMDMHKLFLKFLFTFFDVSIDEIKINCSCYLSENIEVSEIENYWLTNLSLTSNNLLKTTINTPPISSKQYHVNKLKYGVLRIQVHRTDIIQHIFGAIQEYGNFTNLKWLDGSRPRIEK